MITSSKPLDRSNNRPIAAGVLLASVGYTRMFQIMAGVALIVTAVFYLVSRAAGRQPSAVEVGRS